MILPQLLTFRSVSFWVLYVEKASDENHTARYRQMPAAVEEPLILVRAYAVCSSRVYLV